MEEMNVPLLDLKAQFEPIREDVIARVMEVFETQHYVLGQPVRDLEAAVAQLCQARAAVGLSSGTDALIVALTALGVGQETPACRVSQKCRGCDEVITTPFTFFGTAGAIWRVGARPVFVDIDPVTFNIDPAAIEPAITENTRAILPVHLYGQAADMDPILSIARDRGIPVVEDCAQSIGATYKGRPAGSLGDIGCFSFYPTKNLSGAGDGGMVTSVSEDLAQKMTHLRNHGMNPKYFHTMVGGNFRLDSIQAAVVLAKLPHLEQWAQKRRANAALYDQLLADCTPVTCPVIAEGNVSVYNQYVVRVPDRDVVLEKLRAANVGCEIYYPLSLHKQACFQALGYREGDFPASELAEKEVLALPIFPELQEEQIRYVAAQLRKAVGD